MHARPAKRPSTDPVDAGPLLPIRGASNPLHTFPTSPHRVLETRAHYTKEK